MAESNETNAGSSQGQFPLLNNATVASSSTARRDLVFPSQLLEQSRMETPPARLFAENTPLVAPAFEDFGEYDSPSDESTIISQRFFVEQANALINAALSRTSEGTSVVEPDSVLGESGRLYHGYKDGKYFLPNDAAEQDRLDFQHQIFDMLFDGLLALAPLRQVPRFVLDIGTGTGIWANEFATRYPSSFVIGTDLSAIQPTPKVPNCVFQKDDAEAPWLFPLPTLDDHVCHGECEHRITFDYVHLRLMFSCFQDPQMVMRHAFENMSPGGWIEYQDAQFEFLQRNPKFEGNAISKYLDACARGAAASGRDILVPKRYKNWLEKVGFVDVEERKFFSPCGPWPDDPKLRKIGQYQLRNICDGARGVGWKMLRAAGMEPDEVELLISQVETEATNRRNHGYGWVYVIYGRKPFEGETGNL